jgi:group I intron endonuclease
MVQSGIYKIESKIKPERIYIGSAKNISFRWNLHKRELSNKKHHSHKLQWHVNKYGIDDLQFIILEECALNDLLSIEQKYLDTLHPYFNECKIAGSRLYIKVSKKTRRLQSKKRLGKKHNPMSEDGRNSLIEAMKGNQRGKGNVGKVRTEEVRQKLREKTIAFYETEEGIAQKEYNRKLSTGKKQSRETIEKRMKTIFERKQRIKNELLKKCI